MEFSAGKGGLLAAPVSIGSGWCGVQLSSCLWPLRCRTGSPASFDRFAVINSCHSCERNQQNLPKSGSASYTFAQELENIE